MNNPIIVLNSVTASYHHHPVLRDISLTIDAGERVLITGLNGSGKSTLLRLISGTLVPVAGVVTIEGVALNNRRRRVSVRRRIGMVTQVQEDPKIALSVHESVVLGLWGTSFSWLKQPCKEDHERSRRRLALVDMLDYEHRDIRTLSGGQRQRVALARALVRDPQIVLMDEPGTYLDHEAKQDIFEQVLLLQQQMQFTLLVVSHDDQLTHQFDHILHLEKGSIQELHGGTLWGS